MNSSRERRIEELFRRASRLDEPERSRFLDAECEEELRDRVEALLHRDKPTGLLGAAWSGDETTRAVTGPSGVEPGTQIDGYRLLERIGDGGMGEVWLAEQREPVRRRVALKMIKWGMDSAEVMARFEAERQALALMDHPAVAKVFDAGVTQLGRPYFVMEYVAGVPITQFSDERRLSIRERLELFTDLCAGVAHAHQKGIIHRDLKPSNVLVADQDGKPAIKIIDFGVAKATAQRLTEQTLYTQRGMMVGTPAYMSPEQADPAVPDVDTRTDVYSLGATLYEMLVGAVPFDPQELRAAGLEEILRRIREDEPPRPSARLSTLGERSSESASRRRVDLPTLRRRIRGELDWVVMRALEKDRNRRYESPSALAADVERYLNDEPVLAGPPSATYRTRKFVKRHRFGVGVAVVGLVSVVAFGVAMALLASRVVDERDRANTEAQVAGRVTDFVTGLFQGADARESDLGRMTALQLVEHGVAQVQGRDDLSPPVRARVLATLGQVLADLGQYDRALPLLEEAVTLDPLEPGTMNELASAYMEKTRLDEAETLLRQVLERQRREHGPESEQALEAERRLAILCTYEHGRFEESLQIAGETARRATASLGAGHPVTLRTHLAAAGALTRLRRWEDAEKLLTTTLATSRRALGDDHRDTLTLIDQLAGARWRTNGPEAAEALYTELVERRGATLGPTHPRTLSARNNLARLWLNTGRAQEAVALYREICEAQLSTLGPDHRSTQICLLNTGVALSKQRKWAEAETYFQRVYEIRRESLGPEHRLSLRSLNEVARTKFRQGQHDQALALAERVLEARRRTLGDDPDTVTSLTELASAYEQLGRAEAAARYLRDKTEMERRLTAASGTSP